MLLLWLAGPVPNIDSKAVCSKVQRIEPPVAKEAMERIVVSLEPRLSVWVQTSTAEGDDYEHSSVLWASGFVAARWLAHDGRCRGKRVMELGAGCGLVGLSIAALSAPKSTVLTDLPHAVPALRRAIAENGWVSAAIGAAPLTWNEAPPLPPTAIGTDEDDELCADVLIASDVMYNGGAMRALLATVKRFMARGGAMYAVSPTSRPGLAEFLSLARADEDLECIVARASPELVRAACEPPAPVRCSARRAEQLANCLGVVGPGIVGQGGLVSQWVLVSADRPFELITLTWRADGELEVARPSAFSGTKACGMPRGTCDATAHVQTCEWPGAQCA
jgi:predicted nicotinamide N-methyase